jgi:hypothetical protein
MNCSKLYRARRILGEATVAESTRRLAACIVRNLEAQTDKGPDVTQITISYVCGHDFVVHNGTGSYVTLDWTIDGSDEAGGLTLPPHSDQRVFVENPGTLRLKYEDRLIGTASAQMRACQ